MRYRKEFDRNIFDYLPAFYRELRESHAILSAKQAELERLNSDIDDVLDQFFVDTATWGLDDWERVVGVVTDDRKPINERRAIIVAKLRGSGVSSVELIKNVAESWYGGETDVREENAEYKVVVKFVSTNGVPTNLGDVETALREIVPAHLDLSFEFSYLLIREVHDTLTINELNEIPMNQFAGGGD